MESVKPKIMHPASSKSGAFLLELLLVILFFSIASAVCVELFVKSYTLSEKSMHLNTSVLCAENIAELFLASDSGMDILVLTYPYYPEKSTVEETIQGSIYFDEFGDSCDPTSAVYVYHAVLRYSTEDTNELLAIQVFVGDELSYQLNVQKHVPYKEVLSEN